MQNAEQEFVTFRMRRSTVRVCACLLALYCVYAARVEIADFCAGVLEGFATTRSASH